MQLARHIGNKALLIITLNSIIGTGIFFLGSVGARIAGPASLISWVLVSIISIMIATYFAELVSKYPKSGGAYIFTKKAFGDTTSFIVGWTSWIAANITISMLIVGSLFYVFPNASYTFYILLSLFLIFIFNLISYRGIKLSTNVLLFFGVITIFVILILVSSLSVHVNTNNFNPFFLFPISSIFVASYIIFETFFGWETTTYLAEEVKDPKKTIPRVLIYSTIIIGIFSIILVFVSIGSVGYQKYSIQEIPYSYITNLFYGQNLSIIIIVLTFITLIGTAASWIISTPRLLYSMSKEKALPELFGDVHEKFQTPYKSIIFQFFITSIITIIAMASYMLLLTLLIPLQIIVYSFVILSYLKLRNVKGEYKSPFGRIGAYIVLLFFVLSIIIWSLFSNGSIDIILSGIILILIGLPMYIVVKLHTDKKFVKALFNHISPLWDIMIRLWYNEYYRNLVISKLSLKKNDHVLDFGCGTGLTSKDIINKFDVRITCVDISEKQLEKAKDRLKENRNIIFLSNDRIKNKYDAVVSVGSFEYDEPKEKIQFILKLLKKEGRFSFLIFGPSFWIPSNKEFNDKKELKKLFDTFDITYKIEHKIHRLTEMWVVYGSKK